jgi:hypothetical protein
MPIKILDSYANAHDKYDHSNGAQENKLGYCKIASAESAAAQDFRTSRGNAVATTP